MTKAEIVAQLRVFAGYRSPMVSVATAWFKQFADAIEALPDATTSERERDMWLMISKWQSFECMDCPGGTVDCDACAALEAMKSFFYAHLSEFEAAS